MEKTTVIPRLDLSEYTHGSTEQQTLFVEELGKAFMEIGFVTISNHGLSTELIDSLYATIKDFFDLPDSIKKKYEKVELAGQRGSIDEPALSRAWMRKAQKRKKITLQDSIWMKD